MFQRLCGKESCKKGEGNVEGLPNLVFHLQESRVEFSPREYLFLEDDWQVLRVGISTQVEEHICNKRELLIGGFGFGKLNPIFTINGDKVDVTLFKVNPPPEPSHKLRTFFIIFLLLLLVSGIAAFAYHFFIIRRQKERSVSFQKEELVI